MTTDNAATSWPNHNVNSGYVRCNKKEDVNPGRSAHSGTSS